MLNIIICGAPGCGKGTQSKYIVDKYNLKHLSTGDLLRNEMASKSELGKEAEAFISKGNLVPDDMIINILKNALSNIPGDVNGVILDGFPRTVEQAEALEQMMNENGSETSLLLDLKVDNEELISRLLIRGETSGRSDDNLETIKKRLQVYEQKTAPVNEFYRNIGKYVLVDGMGEMDDVFGRISSVLNARIN